MYVLLMPPPPNVLTLTRLRRAVGLTQAQLATAAGIARATVNRLERGHPRSLDLDTIARLADALGVPTAVVYLAVEASRSSATSPDASDTATPS